jgi:hypothetical protein
MEESDRIRPVWRQRKFTRTVQDAKFSRPPCFAERLEREYLSLNKAYGWRFHRTMLGVQVGGNKHPRKKAATNVALAK